MKRINTKEDNLFIFDEKDWTSDQFVLNFKVSDSVRKKIPKLHASRVKMSPKLSRPSQSLIDVKNYKNLVDTKDKIGNLKSHHTKSWNKWVRLLNPYEKIGSFSMLSSDVTISRAFYKLYEILIYFEDRLGYCKNSSMSSLHLCEAPGGFISAVKYLYPQVDWYAQTLYEGGGALDVNESLDSSRWLFLNDEGEDGNLYKLGTIKSIENVLSKKMDLITGDGGFDVSYDYNNQEQFSLKLIFGECICALHCQSIGGSFVCKIFDSMTRPTGQLIVLLMRYYKSVNIVKPRTSRISNAEKYIVAIGFEGINTRELMHFDKVLENWGENEYCRNFGLDIDSLSFMGEMKGYNNFLSMTQSWYIHQSICCERHFEVESISRLNPNSLEALQNKRALEFCTAFDLTVKSENENMYVCSHTRVTKTGYDKNVFRCNKCLHLLVNTSRR